MIIYSYQLLGTIHPLTSTGATPVTVVPSAGATPVLPVATPVPIVPTVTTPGISYFNLLIGNTVIILEIDVKKLIIDRIFVSFHADLTDPPKTSLPSLANQLYTSGLISNQVKDKPPIDEFISEFN